MEHNVPEKSSAAGFAKVARAGIEPLRELEAARHAREAHECIYVAVGEITDNARAFAAEKNIRLLHDAELAQLFPSKILHH